MDFYGAPEFELPKCSLNAASKGSELFFLVHDS